MMYYLYLQNKKSKMKIPAKGTARFPLYFVGTADVYEDKISKIKIDPRWNEWMKILSLIIDSTKFRAYIHDGESGRWIEDFDLEFLP